MKMNIKTIEERLKIKADKIGVERASTLVCNPSELREAFALCSDCYGAEATKRKIVKLDGWDVAEVYKLAMTKWYQQQALEELRAALVGMQDRLSEIIYE